MNDFGELRSLASFLLPGVQHERVDGLGAVHGRRETIASFDGLDHVLVAPVPVRALAVRHHFPHHDAVRPNVRGGSELLEGDGLRGSPPHRNLSTLIMKIRRN